MRKKMLRLLLLLAVGLIFTFALANSAQAQRGRQRGPVSPAIPEDLRPSSVLPWFVSIGMGALTIFVAIKPAKRTHMD